MGGKVSMEGKVKNLFKKLSKRIVISLLALIVILIPLIYLTILNSPIAKAAWYNDSWGYRQTVTITNSGSTQTNYQILITLHTATLITAGKMQSDCDDIRIADSDGTTLLNFWLEEGITDCNNAATKIWTKVPSIPSSATVYVYYGNSSATNSESGTDVFELFDDFSGSSLDATKWTKFNGGSPSFSSGEMTVTGNGDPSKIIATGASQSDNYVLRARFKITAGSGGDDRAGLGVKTGTGNGQGYNYVFHDFSGTDEFDMLDDSICWCQDNSYDWSTNTYYVNEIYHDGTNVKGRINDGSWYSTTRSGRSGYLALNISSSSSDTTVWDFTAVRQIASTEPSVGSPGSEETPTSGVLTLYWKFDEGYGTTVQDSTTNRRNGTLQGSTLPTWQAANNCISGMCLYFNGSSSNIGVGATAPGIQSVSVWVKPDSVTSSALIDLDSGTHKITVSNGTISASGFSSPTIYVNGVVSSTLSAGTWQFVTVTTDADFDATSITLGRSSSTYFAGYIDEVRIYTYAQTPSQIKSDYNARGSEGAAVNIGSLNVNGAAAVAYYDFELGVGSTVADRSGNNNTGTWNGTLGSQWTTGKYGKGGNFNGSNNYVNASAPSPLSSASVFSISFWATSPAYAVNPSAVALRIGTNDPNNLLIIYPYDTENGNGARVYFSGGSVIDINSTSIVSTQWNHFEYVQRSATDRELFINGVSVATNTTSKTLPAVTNFTVGSWDGTQQFFNGKIDDVKVYDYARTQQQVVQDMNAGHPAPGSPIGSAVGYWKFDEGYLTTAYNYGNQQGTSTPINGTLNTFASPATSTSGWTQSAKFGKALIFDGSSDYVNYGNPTSLQLNNGTITGWIKTSNAGLSYRAIMVKQNAYGMFLVDNIFSIYDWGSSNQRSSGVNLADGNWHHVAVTFQSGVTNGTQLWIDGISRLTTTMTVLNQSEELDVGASANVGQFFAGSIDEPKVYSSVLTASQIAMDMNRGQAQVLGALSDNSSYQPNAANQEYCVPGDSTSCAAPVGEWKFEEGKGTAANDSSGNAYTGTLTTGPTWTTGKTGKGINFDGSDDFVDVGTSTSSVKTVSFWVYPTTTTEYPIDINGTAYIWINAGTVTAQGFTSPTIYVNGVVSSTISANRWQYVVVTTGTGLNASDFDIGRIEGVGNHEGKIDNVRIYDYARSAAQVAWDYNRGGPVGYWKMDECSSSSANDSSGNGNIGTITTGASGTQTSVGTCTTVDTATAWYNGRTGKYNYSLNFDGTDDYVSVADMSFTDKIAISVWAKANSVSIGFKHVVGEHPGWFISGDGDTSYMRCGIDTGTETIVNFDTFSNIGTSWHHYVCVYDGSNIYTYLDGKFKNSSAKTGTITSTGSTRIGVYYGEISSTYDWNGQIDDVRIYNYALTATQIKLLMNQGGTIRYGPSTGAP